MGRLPFTPRFCSLEALVGFVGTLVFASFTTGSYAPLTDDPIPAPTSDLRKGDVRVADGKVLRVFEVGDLTKVAQGISLPRFDRQFERVKDRTLFDSVTGGRLEGPWGDPMIVLDLDGLSDLIRTHVDPQSWEREGTSLEASGTKLIAIQDDEVLKKVDALLAELRRSVRPWFELRCVAFRGIEAHGPQRLSIERARELLARAARDGQVVFDSQTRCRAEDALCFSLDRRSAYQQDIDCEVAQGVAIHDPKIAVARGGNNIWLHLGVDPFQKGFVLQGMALHGELEKVDSQNLSPIKGSVEVATTRHACATFAVAQEGSGAFFTRVGALDLLVIVERSDGGGTPEVGTATPRFHSMLALRTAAFSRLEYHFDEHSELPSFHLGSGSDAFNVDALMSIVNLDDDSEEQIQLHNGVLVVPANHARKDLVSQVIKTLGQQQLDCFDVELRREVEVGDGSYRLIGEPLHATSLGGKVAFVSDGKLQDYVADFNVEIAQDKGTFDPVLAAVFSGLQVATSVTSLGDECLVDLVVLGRELLEMRRVVEPADGSGSVDLPSVSDTTFARTVRLQRNGELVLGDGPLLRDGPHERRTRLVLRLRQL